MKVNINYDKFFDSNSTKTIDMTETLNVANNPSINTGLLDSIISNGTINNYSDNELYNLLSTNLRGFLLNIFERKDQRYIKMIISDRFLRILIQVVQSTNLDYMNMTYLNKLCYDYLALDDNSKTVLSVI